MGDPALNYEDSPDLDNESGDFGTENEASNENTASKESEIQNALAAEKAAEVAKRKQALQQQIIAGNNPSPANDNQAMETNKQRQLAQLTNQENQLEKELSELEGSLTSFKNGKSLKLLGFFRSPIDSLVNGLIEEAKKPLRNLDDNAKAKKLEALVVTAGSLMVALKGFKIFTATLDAVLLYRFSVIRVIVFTLPTIIIPIIFLILSPIYLIFLIPLLWIGKIPLLKGPLTDQITKLLETLRRQKNSWSQNLKTLNKKLDIKRQLKKINSAKNQIQGRFAGLAKSFIKTK